MKRLVLPVAAFGMLLLAVGIAVALTYEVAGIDLASGKLKSVHSMPPAYVLANALWVLGAIILIIPPAIAGFELLIVLQIFLTVSGCMAYWQPESFMLKIASRIMLSLLAVGYLKQRNLLQGFTFPWSLLSPRFYFDAWQSGDNRALAVGLEMLGVGYALGSPVMLTIGSAYLVRSSWVTWCQTKQPIFAAWTGLNVAYVLMGTTIVTAHMIR